MKSLIGEQIMTNNNLSIIHKLLLHYSQCRKNPDLSHFTTFLKRLDNPHLCLPPVIHVAGTNGKGSVVAYLNHALQLAGYQVHTTISPHLIQVTERIQVSNQQIVPEEFLKYLKEILTYAKDLFLTYFELITAVAFLAFRHNPADYVLLETGLGGRYDATNVVENPYISVITIISLDHKEILGTTLSDIAFEKAGIIKPGVPVITGLQKQEVEQVIRSVAEKNQSPLHIINPTDRYKLGLVGKHQKANAALAVHILQKLKVSEDIIETGLQTTTWPGRLERILYKEKEIWLDVAHNPDAVHAVVQYLNSEGINQFDLIFSLKRNRDVVEFLAPFLPYASSITYMEQPDYALCHYYKDIQVASNALGVKIHQGENSGHTLDLSHEKRILITGSSLIVGQFLSFLKT